MINRTINPLHMVYTTDGTLENLCFVEDKGHGKKG
jgi:hypothetical protein